MVFSLLIDGRSLESGMLMNMVWLGCSGFQVASSRSDVVDVFSVDISLVLMERLKLVLVFLEGLLLLNE